MKYIKPVLSVASAIRTQRRRFNDHWLTKHISGNLDYTFTVDYTSWLTPIWEQCLAEFKGKEDIKFLEIGSFEGRSTIWFLKNILTHPTSSITCVDDFSRYGGEPRFNHNIRISGYSDRVMNIKGRSEEVLRTLNEKSFDIIYIDGSHYALNVLMDTLLSWLLLKPDGIIIFDDYEWGPERLPLERPKTAIDIFLQSFQTQIEVLHEGYQVIIRKGKA